MWRLVHSTSANVPSVMLVARPSSLFAGRQLDKQRVVFELNAIRLRDRKKFFVTAELSSVRDNCNRLKGK